MHNLFPVLSPRKPFLVVVLTLVLVNSHAFQFGRPASLRPRTTTNLVLNNHVRKNFQKMYQTTFDGDPSDEDFASERRKAILVLFTVPMAWGTFEPAVRYVYEIQPDVPPFVFSLLYYLTAAIALSLVGLVPLAPFRTHTSKDKETATYETTEVSQQHQADKLPIQGGIELGTYLFLGNGLQVVGLKTVPSDRAAFLLQLTTIFVPLVQSILAGNLRAVPTKTWIACLIALSGVAFIGLDGSDSSSLSLLSIENIEFSIGDLYVVLGALFYTFHCIRLEGYAKKTPAAKLAAAKATTETMWCALVVLLCIVAANGDSMDSPVFDLAKTSGDNILAYKDSFLESIQSQDIPSTELLILAAATAWTGLVPVAYTIFAQSFGQSRVSPTTANLIYTIQPFFTALIAFLVLGETLGPAGYVGGTLIGVAVLLVIQGGVV